MHLFLFTYACIYVSMYLSTYIYLCPFLGMYLCMYAGLQTYIFLFFKLYVLIQGPFHLCVCDINVVPADTIILLKTYVLPYLSRGCIVVVTLKLMRGNKEKHAQSTYQEILGLLTEEKSNSSNSSSIDINSVVFTWLHANSTTERTMIARML